MKRLTPSFEIHLMNDEEKGEKVRTLRMKIKKMIMR
jgi:hypothetical protein